MFCVICRQIEFQGFQEREVRLPVYVCIELESEIFRRPFPLVFRVGRVEFLGIEIEVESQSGSSPQFFCESLGIEQVCRDSAISLIGPALVGERRGVVEVGTECTALLSECKSLADRSLGECRVYLRPDSERIFACLRIHDYDSGCEVAVFDGRDAPYDIYRFDIVHRNLSQIHSRTCCRGIAGSERTACRCVAHLEIGVVGNRCAVHYDGCSEAVHRICPDLSDCRLAGGGEGGI